MEKEGDAVSLITAAGSPMSASASKLLFGRLPGSDRIHRVPVREAPVRKALLSVAELVDYGYRIVFEQGQQAYYAFHPSTQEYTYFERREDVFEIDFAMILPKDLPVELQSFPRLEQCP